MKPPISKAKELSRLRILVLEPDPEVLGRVREGLTAAGMPSGAWAKNCTMARRMIEGVDYDVVICNLDAEQGAARHLIDEMRQSLLLPHACVVVFITSLHARAKALEASESGADGCLVLPYAAGALEDHIKQVLQRNELLSDVFAALREGAYELAIERLRQQSAAQPQLQAHGLRLQVELLLLEGRFDEALGILNGVDGGDALPWVQLATVRAELGAGRRKTADTRLRRVITEDPSDGGALDLFGRMMIDQGDLRAARDAFFKACEVTPGSLIRAQHAGALAFFCSDAVSARDRLTSARAIGVESPRLFDGLSLYILGLLEFDIGARDALRKIREEMGLLEMHNSQSKRLHNMGRALELLYRYECNRSTEGAVRALDQISGRLTSQDFSAEDAMICLTSWVRLQPVGGPSSSEFLSWVERMGMRMCTGRGTLAYLKGAVHQQPDVVALLDACQARVTQHTRDAMEACLKGHASKGVQALFEVAKSTLNARLLELCANLATANREQLGQDAQNIATLCSDMADRCGPSMHSIAGIGRTIRKSGDTQPHRTRSFGTMAGSPPSVNLWFDSRV